MKHYFTFSEAIREGAKLRPQGVNGYFSGGKSCAFGAGMEAIFAADFEDSYAVARLYPYIDHEAGGCPACLSVRADSSFGAIIFHLNDDHLWTREQIADWLQDREEELGYVLIVESEAPCTQSETLELVTV